MQSLTSTVQQEGSLAPEAKAADADISLRHSEGLRARLQWTGQDSRAEDGRCLWQDEGGNRVNERKGGSARPGDSLYARHYLRDQHGQICQCTNAGGCCLFYYWLILMRKNENIDGFFTKLASKHANPSRYFKKTHWKWISFRTVNMCGRCTRSTNAFRRERGIHSPGLSPSTDCTSF